MTGSIALTEGMEGEMLTKADAIKIRDDPELNAAFRKVLNLGDWTYVRGLEAESRSQAACLVHDWCDGRLYVYSVAVVYGRRFGLYAVNSPDNVARVVVLKQASNQASALQTQAGREADGRKAQVESELWHDALPELVANARSAVAKLEGVVVPEAVQPLKDLIRHLE